MTNVDNDSAGITVSSVSGNTTEAGGATTFTVVLNSEPYYNVTVNFASNDTGEGYTNVNSLTFTPDNWSTLQTVTITGVNDDIADGDQTYADERQPVDPDSDGAVFTIRSLPAGPAPMTAIRSFFAGF